MLSFSSHLVSHTPRHPSREPMKNKAIRPKKIPVVLVTCHEKIRVGRSEKIFLIIFFMVLAVLNKHLFNNHRYIFPTVYG